MGRRIFIFLVIFVYVLVSYIDFGECQAKTPVRNATTIAATAKPQLRRIRPQNAKNLTSPSRLARNNATNVVDNTRNNANVNVARIADDEYDDYGDDDITLEAPITPNSPNTFNRAVPDKNASNTISRNVPSNITNIISANNTININLVAQPIIPNNNSTLKLVQPILNNTTLKLDSLNDNSKIQFASQTAANSSSSSLQNRNVSSNDILSVLRDNTQNTTLEGDNNTIQKVSNVTESASNSTVVLSQNNTLKNLNMPSNASLAFSFENDMTVESKMPKGYSYNSDCVFPFLYRGQYQSKCIMDGRTEPWCSVTDNYDVDQKWRYCLDQRIGTTLGNSNGARCHFPFVYQGKSYDTCIDRDMKDEYGLTEAKFCGTTGNIDRDGKWGLCLEYSLCHFPYIYDGQIYTNCISTPYSPNFCSTTANFDRDRKWTTCPIVCTGFPEKGEHVTGFNNVYHKTPCDFKQYISKSNGLRLRNYVVGKCHIGYTCSRGYRRLYEEIECKLDGSFDRRAYCIADNFFSK